MKEQKGDVSKKNKKLTWPPLPVKLFTNQNKVEQGSCQNNFFQKRFSSRYFFRSFQQKISFS